MINFQLLKRTEFNKTIIPFALVGYEMVIANLALRASLAIYNLISNALSWNNFWVAFVLVNINIYTEKKASAPVEKFSRF